ncbi:MAG: signal peptidase I [Alphaproteobacteria bacterium]|nr:signal peptidase I [Alphaproteobacteria bacterium]
MPRNSLLSGFGETLRTVLIAVGIAVAIRTVAFEPFNIPSGSMIPSLLIGDYLFVAKYSYGYSRYSLPFGLPLFDGRFLGSEPKRGDIAVFKLPRDNSTDYIKRIVGLPGDRLQVRAGVLHINDSPVPRVRVDDFTETDLRGNVRRIARYRETLPNGVAYDTLDMGDSGDLDNTRAFTVPAGHYFAMGDNRDNSLDSRRLDGVGFIPAVNLVGRAEILFFSVDGERARLWEVWRWPIAIRFGRLLKLVS